jgi:HEPN domain-containing protein
MLLMGSVSLCQRFFDAAKLDLEAAKALKDKELYQPAIYHLQQAYEKCVKSYFILKEVKLKNALETTAYDKAVAFKHKTELSTITLVKDIATLEQDGYKGKLPYLSDQQKIQAVKTVIAVLDSYKSSLDEYVQGLDLRKKYVNVVRHYSNSTTAVYKHHQNSVNNTIVKQPDMRFLHILSCMMNVYPVLYNMELITRYPLKEFSYENLDLLANQHDACEKIIEMLGELFDLVSTDLR